MEKESKQKGKPKPRGLGKYYKKLLKETGMPEEVLAAHIYDPTVQINAVQKQQIKRIRAAWSMLVDFKRNTEVILMLVKTFGITERQAYNDISLSKKVYGDLNKGDKEGNRHIAVEMAQKAFSVAKENADANAMNAAIRQLIILQGLDQSIPNLPSIEDLKGHTFVLQIQTGEEIKTIPVDEVAELNKSDSEKVMEAVNNMSISVQDIEQIMDNE